MIWLLEAIFVLLINSIILSWKTLGLLTSSGGVVLASRDGKIVLENTLDARLEVAFRIKLPRSISHLTLSWMIKIMFAMVNGDRMMNYVRISVMVKHCLVYIGCENGFLWFCVS